MLKVGCYGTATNVAGPNAPPSCQGLPDISMNTLEEGYIDLIGIKEVESGSKDVDMLPTMKRWVDGRDCVFFCLSDCSGRGVPLPALTCTYRVVS